MQNYDPQERLKISGFFSTSKNGNWERIELITTDSRIKEVVTKFPEMPFDIDEEELNKAPQVLVSIKGNIKLVTNDIMSPDLFRNSWIRNSDRRFDETHN